MKYNSLSKEFNRGIQEGRIVWKLTILVYRKIVKRKVERVQFQRSVREKTAKEAPHK